ncbi:hypothetical protein [Streptomyces uncialis]|uniref:hypothetical protein n=1 Tax=Streptomyces uncialis TaxID=1048205 RepID=UPI0033F1B5E9
MNTAPRPATDWDERGDAEIASMPGRLAVWGVTADPLEEYRPVTGCVRRAT